MPKRTKKIIKRALVPILIVVGTLAIARLFLPSVLKWYVNETLDKIPGYKGHVEDIDVALWRGAYQIVGIDLRKVEANVPVPFFRADAIDLSIQWRELFRRAALVGSISLDNPQLNFVVAPTKKDSQTSIDGSWQDRVQELFPLDINKLTIQDGSVHFQNTVASPPIDVHLDQIQITAANLTNAARSYEKLLASVHGTARPMNQGHMEVDLRFNPFEKTPTFELKSKLEGLDIRSLNDFIRHYAGLDAQKGSISIYTEFASSERQFEGYVKPLVKDLQLINTTSKKLTLGQKIKSVFAQLLADVLKNQPKDQLGTKVEFAGTFEDPEISVWSAIRYVFRNGFVKALEPRIENTIKMSPLRT